MSDTDGKDDSTPIKHAPLKSFAKAQTPEMWEGEEEMWANNEAIELLQAQLLEVAQIVWTEAATRTEENDRRTVKPNEIEEAFDELMHPQNVLKNAANEMERLRWEFLDVADESPAINKEDYI